MSRCSIVLLEQGEKPNYAWSRRTLCRDKTEKVGSKRKDTAGKQDREKYKAGGEEEPAESNGVKWIFKKKQSS